MTKGTLFSSMNTSLTITSTGVQERAAVFVVCLCVTWGVSYPM